VKKCKFDDNYYCDHYAKDKCLTCVIRLKVGQTSIKAWSQ